MFQSTKRRLQDLLDIVDDMLVGAPETGFDHDGEPDDDAAVLHPHHRSVQLRIQRRPGTIPARPMHCLSPVRSQAPVTRERAER
jgi:hypothetical protein